MQWLFSIWLFLLPLLFRPAPEKPFSGPKLVWVAAGALVSLALLAFRLRRSAVWLEDPLFWPLLSFAASLGLTLTFSPVCSREEVLLRISPVPCFLALSLFPADSGRAIRVLCRSTLVLSAIALLQLLHLDPIRLAGFQPESFPSPRMRIFATLGNPNFVAAWLGTCLPLFWNPAWQESAQAGRLRRLLPWAWLLPAAAFPATGSRTFFLALPFLLFGAFRAGPARRALLPAAILLITGGAVFLYAGATRPWITALEGRIFQNRVVLRNVSEIPWVGFGAGSFPGRYQAWLDRYGESPRFRQEESRFAGPLDHAHNDYLEFWVEYGWAWLPCLGLFLGTLGHFYYRSQWKKREASEYNQEVLLSLGILAAVALVDFPMHRPAEWTLFWILLSLCRARRTA